MISSMSRSFFAIFVLVLTAIPVVGLDFPQPLTVEEVECDRQQLQRLAFRALVSEVDPAFPGVPENPSLFLWRMPFGGTSFGGLAVTDGVRFDELGHSYRDELQLSLDLVLSGASDVLNPRRPLLPHVSLVRRSVDSNFILSAAEPTLAVTLDAVDGEIDPFTPKIPLTVNNFGTSFGGQHPLAAADAQGRGLARDGLTRTCHSKLTSFDERFFRVISRTLRISNWFSGRVGELAAWNVILFRGEDPHHYRGTIYTYSNPCLNDGTCPLHRDQPIDLDFIVDWDAAGHLRKGDVRLTVLPSTDSIAMFILPPLRPGHDHQGPPEFGNAPFLRYLFTNSPANILTATVDWEALLADTAWND